MGMTQFDQRIMVGVDQRRRPVRAGVADAKSALAQRVDRPPLHVGVVVDGGDKLLLQDGGRGDMHGLGDEVLQALRRFLPVVEEGVVDLVPHPMLNAMA